jgi:hypothetical protein
MSFGRNGKKGQKRGPKNGHFGNSLYKTLNPRVGEIAIFAIFSVLAILAILANMAI